MSLKKNQIKEDVYAFVSSRLRQGDPPSIREVQAALGFKAVETARSYLELLVQEGRLRKRENGARGYLLAESHHPLHDGSLNFVPILGSVQAGTPTLACQDIEGYIPVATAYTEELFALKVVGLSMIQAGILPGDIVVVRRQSSAQSGDIVVALIEEEATVKRLRFAGNQVVLWPENPEFSPLLFSPEDLMLLGKVIEVRRFYELRAGGGL